MDAPVKFSFSVIDDGKNDVIFNLGDSKLTIEEGFYKQVTGMDYATFIADAQRNMAALLLTVGFMTGGTPTIDADPSQPGENEK